MNIFRYIAILFFLALPASAADIDGTWIRQSGNNTPRACIFKTAGDRFTGEIIYSATSIMKTEDGKMEGGTVSFTALDVSGLYTTHYQGAVDGDTLTLTGRTYVNGDAVGNAASVTLRRAVMSREDFPPEWSSQETVVLSARQKVDKPNTLQTLIKDFPYTIYTVHPESFKNVKRELQKMKEVLSVGYLSRIPFSMDAVNLSITAAQPVYKTPPPSGQQTPPAFYVVHAQADRDGFAVLDIPFTAGRPFSAGDIAEALARQELLGRTGRRKPGDIAVIVNQSAAQLLWPGESEKKVIGKVFYSGDNSSYKVVGVVRNYPQAPEVSEENRHTPMMYTPMTGALALNYQLLVKLRRGASLKDFQSNVLERLPGCVAEPTVFEVRPSSEFLKDAAAK